MVAGRAAARYRYKCKSGDATPVATDGGLWIIAIVHGFRMAPTAPTTTTEIDDGVGDRQAGGSKSDSKHMVAANSPATSFAGRARLVMELLDVAFSEQCDADRDGRLAIRGEVWCFAKKLLSMQYARSAVLEVEIDRVVAIMRATFDTNDDSFISLAECRAGLLKLLTLSQCPSGPTVACKCLPTKSLEVLPQWMTLLKVCPNDASSKLLPISEAIRAEWLAATQSGVHLCPLTCEETYIAAKRWSELLDFVFRFVRVPAVSQEPDMAHGYGSVFMDVWRTHPRDLIRFEHTTAFSAAITLVLVLATSGVWLLRPRRLPARYRRRAHTRSTPSKDHDINLEASDRQHRSVAMEAAALITMAQKLLRFADGASEEERAAFRDLWFAESHYSYCVMQTTLFLAFATWTWSSPCHFSIGAVLAGYTGFFLLLRMCLAYCSSLHWSSYRTFVLAFISVFCFAMPVTLGYVIKRDFDPDLGFCPMDTSAVHVREAWHYTLVMWCSTEYLFGILMVLVFRTSTAMEPSFACLLVLLQCGFATVLYVTTRSLFAERLLTVIVPVSFGVVLHFVGLFIALGLTQTRAAAVSVRARMLADHVADGSSASAPSPATLPGAAAECVICFNGVQTHVCVPCGHLCLCGACSENLMHGSKATQCPICRRDCDQCVQIYST